MKVIRCNNCDKFYSDDELTYIQPDVGAFCPECKSADLDFMLDSEVIEELNDLTINLRVEENDW